MAHPPEDLITQDDLVEADLDETGPARTCVVTRQKSTPEHLLRFVRGPNGAIVPDIRAKLPGRGAWVMARKDIVQQGVQRGALIRALRDKGKGAKTPAPTMRADMATFVDKLLEADALQALSLANKAGMIMCGFAKLESGLAQENFLALIHASDGGTDGRRKLGQAQRRFAHTGLNLAPLSDNVTLDIDIFHSGQLSLALGRENVIHAGFMSKPGGKNLLARIRRLIEYRAAPQLGAAEQTKHGV